MKDIDIKNKDGDAIMKENDAIDAKTHATDGDIVDTKIDGSDVKDVNVDAEVSHADGSAIIDTKIDGPAAVYDAHIDDSIILDAKIDGPTAPVISAKAKVDGEIPADINPNENIVTNIAVDKPLKSITIKPFTQKSTALDSSEHSRIISQVESNAIGVDYANIPHEDDLMEIDPAIAPPAKSTDLPPSIIMPPPAPRIVLRPPTRKKPNFDSLLIAASKDSKSTLDTTTPLISHSDLLTLMTFRPSGVAIPSPSSSGYETKSIITDLTILRTPSLWWLYGGTQELEPGGKLASELYHMPRTRKKEKKRDNGQGKAPIKTAEQKLLRKEMMEQAANRKRQMLAEADIRREVKLLAKLEKAEAKGIRLDPQTAQKKMELKAKVGNIVLPKKETKRDRMKKEKFKMEEEEESLLKFLAVQSQ
jgi:hypothetical protein